LEGARSWEQMREWCADLLVKRTGQGVEPWNRRIAERGFADKAALRSWLESEGVTGYAQMLLLVMEQFGYPDFFTASADELIDGQYEDRPQLRPILDAVLAAALELGPVTIQARKGYVSLVSPRRTFAVVKATTMQRVDLGLRIDGLSPGGLLLDGSRLAGAAINLRIALAAPGDLDDEVIEFLKLAYRANSPL
jgi:hypothetical protein